MKYAIICYDKPNHLDLRLKTRDAHVAYLKASEILSQAGPFLNENDEMYGSLLIVDVDNVAKAQEFAANDPYAIAGLFEKVDIRAWNKVI